MVLSRQEVARLLANVDERFATIVTLLYGAGLRLMECLQLRVKDIDFDRAIRKLSIKLGLRRQPALARPRRLRGHRGRASRRSCGRPLPSSPPSFLWYL
ncbi:tyrosine-type recombinase/integrase [Peristeroidobacter agariperforans]|uniref:tyrosine-type recombinase/integrase n=1 Tax=Peristeroidobacter agariperforans TaxID=268404 RepID=UPI00389A86C6